MKISDCPICGNQPGTLTLVFKGGKKKHCTHCVGNPLCMIALSGESMKHTPIKTEWLRTKTLTYKAWNKLAQEYKPAADDVDQLRKCVNGNCSIRATCARYHQAANVFEARGADGLYDSHSCRKGKCDHHLAKEVQP